MVVPSKSEGVVTDEDLSLFKFVTSFKLLDGWSLSLTAKAFVVGIFLKSSPMGKKTRFSHGKAKINAPANKDALQASVSTRRSTSSNKVNEISALCGGEAALIIFGPDGKSFSIGNPSADAVIQRFLSQYPLPEAIRQQVVQAQHEATMSDLNKQYSDLLGQLAAEKKRGAMLKHAQRMNQEACLLHAPVETLSLNDVLTLNMLLEEVEKDIAKAGIGLILEAASERIAAANSAGTSGAP